jgi:hypothetical protein
LTLNCNVRSQTMNIAYVSLSRLTPKQTVRLESPTPYTNL